MFSTKKMGVGLTAPFVYLPGTAGETITAGEALVLSGGKLTKCGATAKPAYIALGPADGNGTVPCAEVQSYMEFQTTLSAAPAEGVTLAPGDKVTLSADALQVTATTESGVATIKRIDAQAVDSVVIVSF
ncbi:hypothetical protein [uncultured Oscillibacter sp.]|uniref:hypothetical protein n=1 Tax=uncultured Oscillibacter sp. TaxID=876091 RepID=UPI0025CF6D40|nr:hypothetical protein [uncultured Oscillibacter sp.]